MILGSYLSVSFKQTSSRPSTHVGREKMKRSFTCGSCSKSSAKSVVGMRRKLTVSCKIKGQSREREEALETLGGEERKRVWERRRLSVSEKPRDSPTWR